MLSPTHVKREKEWKENVEKTQVEYKVLEKKCTEIQVVIYLISCLIPSSSSSRWQHTCSRLSSQVEFTNQIILTKQQEIESLQIYTTNYDRDKERLTQYENKERVRLQGLVEKNCQTEPRVCDTSVQTDFEIILAHLKTSW